MGGTVQMINPTFSIIIPSHNGIPHITKALESCKSQTYTDYELIVVADACDDNTEKVAQAYGAKTLAVDYHRDGLTRNAGLDIATGDYILFLDDDDWWLHEFVFMQIASLARKVPDNDIYFFSIIYKGRGYYMQTADHYERFVAGHLIRRSFIGDIRFNDKQFGSDYDFFDALIAKNPVCTFWNMPMYYYNHMRPGSLTYRWVKGEFNEKRGDEQCQA